MKPDEAISQFGASAVTFKNGYITHLIGSVHYMK